MNIIPGMSWNTGQHLTNSSIQFSERYLNIQPSESDGEVFVDFTWFVLIVSFMIVANNRQNVVSSALRK